MWAVLSKEEVPHLRIRAEVLPSYGSPVGLLEFVRLDASQYTALLIHVLPADAAWLDRLSAAAGKLAQELRLEAARAEDAEAARLAEKARVADAVKVNNWSPDTASEKTGHDWSQGDGRRCATCGAYRNLSSGFMDCPGTADARESAAEAAKTEAARVADPGYIPTLAEAMRNPAELVAGMIEEGLVHHASLPPGLVMNCPPKLDEPPAPAPEWKPEDFARCVNPDIGKRLTAGHVYQVEAVAPVVVADQPDHPPMLRLQGVEGGPFLADHFERCDVPY